MSGVFTSPNAIAGDITIANGNMTFDNSRGVYGKIVSGSSIPLILIDNSDNLTFGQVVGFNDMRMLFPTNKKVEFTELITQRARIDGTGLSVQNQTRELQTYEQLAQAWCRFDGTGTISITDSYNVANLTDLGVGQYQVNFSNVLASSNFAVAVAGNAPEIEIVTTASGFVQLNTRDRTGTLTDYSDIHLIVME